ncbi:hypothetical protein [Tautonia marina]|nr:hypothetical protein [Tautonia marina]
MAHAEVQAQSTPARLIPVEHRANEMTQDEIEAMFGPTDPSAYCTEYN